MNETDNPAAESDPWGLTAAPEGNSAAQDPWGLAGSNGTDAAQSWLHEGTDASSNAAAHVPFPELVQIAINDGLGWVVTHFRPFFQAVRTPIDSTLTGITELLLAVPWPLMLAAIALLAWQCAGRVMALIAALALGGLWVLGIWPQTMITLALVLTSLVFCLLLGLPLGIVLAASDRAQSLTRPLLDAMQTTPAFVYLVPVVMLFGTGNVPGVIVTIIFALPPLVRLTNLGIRQVRPDLIEASLAYGASPWQLLHKVQLPLALPSIMAGVNQALMLSLSMVVIASMISVAGLGQMVLRGIGRLDMGLAAIGGLGIVMLAIVLDRITQSMGQPARNGKHWYHHEPLGWLLHLAKRKTPSPTTNNNLNGEIA